MVPKVAMKGGSLNRPTKMPLITPQTRQQARATAIAITGLISMVISVAETMALMPTMDPMERSILPVMSR